MSIKEMLALLLQYCLCHCNIRNILFLLCLYLKRGNKLNVGLVWFEGKAPSQTSKTCLTMVEPFAGPSSMAMGNQPMPSMYPLRKRLSKGGMQGFLLTLWSGGETIFFSKHIDFILIWYTTKLNCPQTIDSHFPALPSPVTTLLLHLLLCASVLLVGCCVIFIRWRPSKAMAYFRCHFFSSSICRSKQRDNTPPHILPRSPLLFNAPPTVDANFWLVVVSPHQTAAI